MTAYAVQAITLNGSQYSGVVGESSDRQRKIRKDASDGTVHRTLVSAIRTAPKADLRTLALLTMLPVLNDSTDIPCKALNGSTGLVLWGGKADTTKPGYNASGVHRRRTGISGLLCADSISWSPGNAAEMAMSAYFIGATGSTDPLADSDAGTLPSLPVPAEALVLTALTRGGSPITDISGFTVNIDHKCTNEKDPECYSAGLPHPVSILTGGVNDAVDITLDLESTNLSLAESAGETWVATYTKLAQGGTIGSTGVILTFSNVYGHDLAEGGNYPGKAKKTSGETRFDGTNKPFAWTTF